MEREKVLKKFELGSKERNQRREEFEAMVQETFGKISQLEQEVKPLEDFVEETSEAVKDKQQELVNRYLENAREMTQNVIQEKDASGFFSVLVDRNWDEKVEFLAAICQWYGEMRLASGHGRHPPTVCDPLKMAALDAGILWDGSSVQVPKGWGEELVMPLLSRMGYTSRGQLEKEEEEWTDPEDEIMDGDYHHDHGYYDDDDVGGGVDVDDDEQDDEHTGKNHLRRRARHRDESGRLDDSKAQYTMISNDFQCIYGKIMRSNFHQQAKEILSRLDSTMKSEESSDETVPENETDEKTKASSENDQTMPLVDPMAIQMVRNTLSSRIGQIEYGNTLAKSAITMMKSLQDNKDINDLNPLLDTLLVGTINYSKIGEVDAEEILAVVTATNISSETCFSPYMVMCDGSATTRKESVLQRCAQRKDATFCMARSQDASSEPVSIPSHVPDGFLNYYVPRARGADDYFTTIFETYHLQSSFEDSNIPRLEEELQNTTKEVETRKNQINQMKNDLGLEESGTNSPKYGTNGELYALRDKCFSIPSGKYTYEVCLFGRAYQREGSAKTGGTDLGKWNGSSVDDATGTRVWKWTGGAKCWNGPSRSATVYVTCGAETQLISADEPNICEYVFQMESYIACDDRYKLAHEL
jgi:protein kinase C substrate 80K-H